MKPFIQQKTDNKKNKRRNIPTLQLSNIKKSEVNFPATERVKAEDFDKR